MRLESIPIEKALKHNSGSSDLAFNRICRFYAFLFSFSTCLRLHRQHRREISLSFFACRVTFAAKTSNSPVTHETLLMRMRLRASDEKLPANETKEIKKGFNRKSKLIYGKDFRFRGPENDSKFINERRSNQDCVSQRWPLRQFGEKVVRPVKSVNISAMHVFNPVRSSEQTLMCTCSRLSNRFWDFRLHR